MVGKKLKLVLFVLLPIICLVIAGIPFTLADYPEKQTEQTMNGTSAEDTGASTADKSLKGGALYISGGASYTMTGGSITGKTNQYGGAVYVTNGSTFTMTGGTITGCSALYGGAIYVEAGGTCNITGGTITGNKAQFAPAIYVEDGATLNVDQTAIIKDNEYGRYGNALEIYVDGTLAKTMYLKADTYTIKEADMPLQYENCCGYFLDEKLSQCSFGEVALTSEAMGFAPRTADVENYVAKLYTRTANPNNFTFTFNGTTQTYDIKAKDTTISGHIVLPKEYDNTQTSIYSIYNSSLGAFYNCTGVTGVTFQEGLTTMGGYAFYRLTSLVEGLIIPNSVTTILHDSFSYCSGLTGSLIIPNSVTSIGNEAFRSCSGLTGVIIPNSVTSIEGGAFSYCSGLTSVTIPNSVTSIGDNLFSYCSGLTSVTIPNSVTSIGDHAFSKCSGLTGELIIPDSVTSIGNSVFRSCSGLTEVKVSSGNTVYEDRGKNAIIEKSTKTIIQGFNCTDLSVLEEVTSIGDWAFSCSGLTSVTIPNSVTSIRDHAFNSCSGLTSVTIGDSVTSIGKYAFHSCSGLTSVYIPSSVTTISVSSYIYAPFSGCSSSLIIYTDVVNSSSVPSGWSTYWNYYANGKQLEVVYGCSLDSEGNIVVPTMINVYVDDVLTTTLVKRSSSYVVDESDMPLAYENCCGYFLDETLITTIKNDVVDLSNGDVNLYTRTADPSLFSFTTDGADGYIIAKNISVTYSGTEFSLVMPREYNGKTITTINDSAFKEVFGSCGSVNIVLSSEINIIPQYCFDTDYGDTPMNIGSVNLHNNITEIGEKAFSYCDGDFLNQISNSVTSIGDYAFYGCSRLTSVTIGDSVTSIGNSAFSYCSRLTSVTIPDSVTSIGKFAFSYCSGLTSVYIPSTVTTITALYYYSAPFSDCSSSLVIYTDVANASSVPSGWGAYWNYYGSGTLTVNYGYTLEQYKSAVGLTFAPNGEEISSVEVETIENINDYQADNSYLQDVVLNKNEYVAILKENEKIA